MAVIERQAEQLVSQAETIGGSRSGSPAWSRNRPSDGRESRAGGPYSARIRRADSRATTARWRLLWPLWAFWTAVTVVIVLAIVLVVRW